MTDDHHRVLEVDPRARPGAISAAFTVPREIRLRGDDADASRRLAALNAAHRTPADPVRRADDDAAGGPGGGRAG